MISARSLPSVFGCLRTKKKRQTRDSIRLSSGHTCNSITLYLLTEIPYPYTPKEILPHKRPFFTSTTATQSAQTKTLLINIALVWVYCPAARVPCLISEPTYLTYCRFASQFLVCDNSAAFSILDVNPLQHFLSWASSCAFLRIVSVNEAMRRDTCCLGVESYILQ